MINYVLKLTSIPRSDDSDRNDLGCWEDIIITKNLVLPMNTYVSHAARSVLPNDEAVERVCIEMCLLKFPDPMSKFIIDVHMYAQFLTLLTFSEKFRSAFLRRVCQSQKQSRSTHIRTKCEHCQEIFIPCTLQAIILWPRKLSIDYKWNYKVKDLVYKQSELENLSAWLSTLGGAFSSLGEASQMFAFKAQKTSLHQMKVAIQLDNPLLMSRCRLYYAISLLQRNELRKARKIVENEYLFAKSEVGRLDFKLANMCLGIWAKLKYLHQLKRLPSAESKG